MKWGRTAVFLVELALVVWVMRVIGVTTTGSLAGDFAIGLALGALVVATAEDLGRRLGW